MPYQFEWIVPQRVVYSRIYDEVKTEEMNEIITHSREKVLSSQHPVHFIIDLSAIKKQPFTLAKMNEWTSNIPNGNGSWWIVINTDPVIMFVISLVTKAVQVNLKSAQSVEDAVQILTKLDQTVIEQLPQTI